MADKINISNCFHSIPSNETQCISIILQICNQLKEIHQSGLIHLDIRPENIEISSEDGKASLLSPRGLFPSDKLISPSHFLYWGDSYYAPELKKSILNEQPFTPDASSDIYSLMLTVYFLITRQIAPYNFQFHTKWRFILRQSTAQWSRQPQDAIESLFRIGTRLNPLQRPQNAADFMQTDHFIALKNAMEAFL